jgi:VIT1/CCC1 family predicted Fe2+/Mn2+ transporter
MTDASPRTLDELKAEHRPPPPGRNVPQGEEHEQSGYRNYVRDLVLGFNDGVVSVYALCAGVAGAAFSAHQTALAGVAASVAGAISMGLGEYVSTKSQREYYEAEARREREHIRSHPDLERAELRELFTEKQYPPAVVDTLVEHVASDEKRFVDTMMREEFGVGKESQRSPWTAMALVMAAFLVGAALPVLPFFVLENGMALRGASALAIAGLFTAGAAKARVAGLPVLRGGVEMSVLGALAAVVTYGVGIVVEGAFA